MKQRPQFFRLIASLASCLLGLFSLPSAATSVSGTVRDAAGNALSHAQVTVIPQGRETRDGVVGDLHNRWTAANEKGEFRLDLSPGRYKIRAKAEADGYPDPTFWLNADPAVRFPEISVGEKEIKGLEVKLRTQGGILDGNLQDKQDHKPLVGAEIRIQDARNSDAFVGVFTDSSGHFQFTVPSKPIVISAAASGHRPLVFQSGAQLILSKGEHRHIDFELERE